MRNDNKGTSFHASLGYVMKLNTWYLPGCWFCPRRMIDFALLCSTSRKLAMRGIVFAAVCVPVCRFIELKNSSTDREKLDRYVRAMNVLLSGIGSTWNRFVNFSVAAQWQNRWRQCAFAPYWFGQFVGWVGFQKMYSCPTSYTTQWWRHAQEFLGCSTSHLSRTPDHTLTLQELLSSAADQKCILKIVWGKFYGANAPNPDPQVTTPEKAGILSGDLRLIPVKSRLAVTSITKSGVRFSLYTRDQIQ